MITLTDAISHTNYSQVIWFEILGPSCKTFIGPLDCCLRSSNEISQMEAVLDP
jgi:hypothetical protein